MTATAVIAVRNAIVAAILADAPLAALLQGDKVYLRRPPVPTAPLPYITLGPVSERDGSRYMDRGHEGLELPTCWGTTVWQADQVFAALYPVLHNRRLTLAGHVMRYPGKLVRLTDHADPDLKAHGVFCSYRVPSREVAA